MLQTGFILLTIVLAITLFAGINYAANASYTEKRKRMAFKIKGMSLIILWLTYVSVLSLKHVFINAAFPPRIPALLVFPAFGFIAYFFMSGRYRNVIGAIPLQWMVYFQTFRIVVELLLFGLFMEHMLPWSATFEGYNFDIGIGISAPFMGYFVAKKRVYNWALRAWNIMGICTLFIVVYILNTYAYHPTFLGQTETILGKGFGTFPFTFLASFFMPTAMFMHFFVLARTSRSADEKYFSAR